MPASEPPHTSADAARGDERARRLEAWDHRARPWIVLAALLPIIASVTAGPREGILIIVDFAGWAVFLADLIVHLRNKPHYLRSGLGMFDLSVVVITFPWYIIPGLESTDILLLARVARVARLFFAGAHMGPFRRLIERLGRAALYASLLVIVCTLVLEQVEHHTNGFDDLGDSLWFSIVTLTTVGYGDIVPQTSAGRLVAVALMLGGLSVLGALAGSLGAFLRVQDTGEQTQPEHEGTSPAGAAELAELRTELAEVNSRLAALQAHLGVPEQPPPPASDRPHPP